MWRVIQALGACAGVVLGRAVVSDLYKGRRAAQTLSTLASVTAIAPLIGPIIGGQILRFASWHTLFWVLMLIGIATLVFLSILPETLEPARRRRESPWHAVMAYLQLLRHRAVIAYAGVGACFYAGVFAYVAGSPAAYITYYHLSPQHYGVLFGLGIVGIMASNQINKRLVMRFGSVRLLWVGVGGLLLAAFILQVNVWTGWGGLAALALPLFAFIGMNGFIVANSIARAFSHFPERAGAVSALIGTLHYAVSILGATLVGLFADGTPRSLGSVVGLSAIGVLVCLGLTPKHD
jgi:DHA1 family bicyclomycin/chloramphenicol resistance-like MFS transporter